jgi:hypothetical protein
LQKNPYKIPGLKTTVQSENEYISTKTLNEALNSLVRSFHKGKKVKAVPVIGREGPYGSGTSRFPQFPDNPHRWR